MDESNKNPADKKVFILSPDELGKFGILDAVKKIKNKQNVSSSSSSSSSASSNDTSVTKSDLFSIFKGKKLLSKNKNGDKAFSHEPTNKILSTETTLIDKSKSASKMQSNTKKSLPNEPKNINNVTIDSPDQTDKINMKSEVTREDTSEGKTENISNTRLSSRSVKKEMKKQSDNPRNIIINQRDKSDKRAFRNSAKLEETSTTSKPETTSQGDDLHAIKNNLNAREGGENPATVPKKRGRPKKIKEPDETQRSEKNDYVLENSEAEHSFTKPAELVEDEKKEISSTDLEEMIEIEKNETPTVKLGKSSKNKSNNSRTRIPWKSINVESPITTSLEKAQSEHHVENEVEAKQKRKNRESKKEEIDDENNASEHKKNESEYSTTPVTQKRKRGRPPKIQKPLDLTPSVIPEAPQIATEQSKKGRTHIKVQYQDMDSEYKEFETSDLEESTPTTSSTEVTKKKRGRKRKTEFIEDTEETVTYNKRKKTSEEADDTVTTLTESQENILAKSSESIQESLSNSDEEIKVTCCLCKSTISESQWPHHNETIHNNLSWRDGETPMSLDDPNVKIKLKPILSKNKSLTCSNCKTAGFKLANFIQHLEECTGIVVEGNVTCAKCNETMRRDSWPHHKSKHNNLAWRVGDHPLDLNDEALVVRTLKVLVKAKKPLYCEKCGASKKSVAGMLSHMAACGNEKNVKVKCDLCGREMLPYSLPIHMRAHEAKRASKATDHFEVDSNNSSTKRRAATKAMDRLKEFTSDLSDTSKHFVKQINFEEDDSLISHLQKELEENDVLKCMFDDCGFSCREVESLVSHLNNCSSKPEEYYLCKTCFVLKRSESEMIKHIKSSHDIKVRMKIDTDYVYDEDESNALEEVLETRRSVAKKSDYNNKKIRPNFIYDVSRKMTKLHQLFSHAFHYTFEFAEKNYNQKDIFPSFKCNESDWRLISEDRLEDYIPSAELSCDVSTIKVKSMVKKYENYAFKKYELFEIEQSDESTTIFCGAPIRCMAWLPTPYDSLEQAQILAVATGKDFDEKYQHLEHRSEATVIQFWNFGVLKNDRNPPPTLEFCLGIDEGPVWHLEWCPSGCFNVERNRRGLLAVGGSSMDVNIYSIPFLSEDKGLFYKAKPVITLKLVLDERNLKRIVFPTKISWSKVSGHNYIAAGYSDGTVAVYNLGAISDSPSSILLPYKVLKNHTHCISALFFIPLDEGNRWLVSSSFDRNVYVYDLYNNDKFSCKKGKVIVDGSWMMNWLCFLLGSDEATSIVQPIVAAYSCREFLYAACNLSYSLSTVLTISTSDWLNSFVHGNETGEIILAIQHQMLYDNDKQRSFFDNRYLASYVKLVDKALQPEDVDAVVKIEEETWHEPLTYKEATGKYGVVFCDAMSNFNKEMVQSNSEPSKPNLYPLSAVNKVCFNPNRQACLHYASGYQIGFVRLHYLKFLENRLDL